jgi:hypothetical protein
MALFSTWGIVKTAELCHRPLFRDFSGIVRCKSCPAPYWAAVVAGIPLTAVWRTRWPRSGDRRVDAVAIYLVTDLGGFLSPTAHAAPVRFALAITGYSGPLIIVARACGVPLT